MQIRRIAPWTSKTASAFLLLKWKCAVHTCPGEAVLRILVSLDVNLSRSLVGKTNDYWNLHENFYEQLAVH